MRGDHIVMAHGGGGELSQRLLRDHILPRLGNEMLGPLDDGALLPQDLSRLCMTTDSFVVQPIDFPGGDIGHLAVCGTVNDLAVMGARPRFLSLGMILEEGLPLSTLDRILDSVAAAAAEAGVQVVTGDTKVVEHRGGDGLMINTAGIGELREGLDLGASRIEGGDLMLINGGIAEHGLAVMSVRKHLEFQTQLKSDAAVLSGLIDELLKACGDEVKFLRDPTRGGLAVVAADLVEERGLSLELEEESIPLSSIALHTAELLGLDPLSVANEGKVVVVVSEGAGEKALAAMRAHPLGEKAAVIGRFTAESPALAELLTRGGGRRMVTRPYGEELPRIC